MTAKELRAMTPADLEKKLADLKAELFALRFQHATNQLENPIRIADVRKDIARVKTVIRENEIKG
ncbi:MAG: 50S ribosomal protein L29 [Clostridia bacterium]|jgi:large subunit ribosomal protein L29|nr:50S ribosomal protein L29 [Clostridia bacterium]